MTLKWKDNITDIEDTDITLGDMIKDSPRKYVVKKEKFCNHCNNPETAIRGLKHLTRFLSKGYIKVIWRYITENNIKTFGLKDLIKGLNAENLTDGSLQRKSLAILTSLGFLKKEIKEYEIKINKNKSVKKMRYIFHRNNPISPPPCYNKEKDTHDSKEWRETKYFI